MGPTAIVFLKADLTDDLAIRVDAQIRSISSIMTFTRKGRDWEVMVEPESSDGRRLFHIHLWDTREQLWDCEDLLHDLGMDESELPTYLGFSAVRNHPEDWRLLACMTKSIASAMDGIPTEPKK